MGIKEQVFKQSIEIYGKEAQSRQAMEECAELIQAINKCLRHPNKEECKNNLYLIMKFYKLFRVKIL